MFLVLRPVPKLAPSVDSFTEQGLASMGAGLIDVEPEENTKLAEQLQAFIDVKEAGHEGIDTNPNLILVTSTFAAQARLRLPLALQEKLFAKAYIIAVGSSTRKALHTLANDYDIAMQEEQIDESPHTIASEGSQSVEKIIAAKPANSEGIINAIVSLPIATSNILLCKGKGGRGLIEKAMEAKGIGLTIVDCYQRVRLSTPVFTASFAQDQIHCIIATSTEIVDAAYLEFKQEWLNGCRWIVVSERIQQHLRALGATKVTVSNGATDKHLIAAAKQVKGLENV
jgi:uroporphyrinogen-III synthase